MEGLAGSNTIHFIDRLFSEVKRHIPGASNLPVEAVSLIVDNHQGIEVPHYSEFFSEGRTNEEEYGWSVEVPLCSEGTVIFLYNYDSADNIKCQKIHVPFGCALIIRSDVLNGGYGGKKGSLRLRGTFHTTKYNDENDNVTDQCYVTEEQVAWLKYLELHNFVANTINKNCVIKCDTLKKEVEKIPTLLQSSYFLPKDILDVLAM